jgi:hypothetical protein
MQKNRVIILGLGRSGTSWTQKVFDHHPQVFALFEPENMILQKAGRVCRHGTDAECRELVDQIMASKHLRAVRRRPILKKPYRSKLKHNLRAGYILGATGVQKALKSDVL